MTRLWIFTGLEIRTEKSLLNKRQGLEGNRFVFRLQEGFSFFRLQDMFSEEGQRRADLGLRCSSMTHSTSDVMVTRKRPNVMGLSRYHG